MKDYIVKTNFNCVIEFGGECEELTKNEYMVFSENDIIKVYPLESKKDCWTFSYSLKLNENCLDEYKLVKLKDKNIVFLKNKYIPKANDIILEKCEKDWVAKLTSFPHSFIVTGDNYFVYSIKEKLISYDISFIEKFIVVYGASEDCDYILIYNKIDNNVFCYSANSISLDKNIIEIKKYQNDIAKHAIKIVLELNGDCVNEKEYSLFYEKGEPILTQNEKIIPIAFLESVKIRNYSLAREYLSGGLAKKLSDKHLKKFFGNISEIIYHNLSYITKNEQGFIEYGFDIEDKKIVNIQEIYQS